MESILKIEKVTKQFPGVMALNKVSLSLKKGSVHALCGENGAGKSTLMHVLAGVYQNDSGIIYLNGFPYEPKNQHYANENGIAIVYQERSLVDGLSVAENIFAARQPVSKFGFIAWSKLNSDAHSLLKWLEVDVDPRTLVGDLSPAQQQMVEIAKALSIHPQILILDEPTATITDRETEALFRLIKRLKSEGVAIIYISHRLSEIFRIADYVSVLKDGNLVETSNICDTNKDRLISKMVGRTLVTKEHHFHKSDEIVLRTRGLTGFGFRNISFVLHKGEIISFAGLVGAGRTELMRAIFGVDPIREGKLEVFGQQVNVVTPRNMMSHGVGYVPEDRKQHGLFLDMSVSKNVVSASIDTMGKGVFYDKNVENTKADDYINKLNIITSNNQKKAVSLSGGNQQKIILAKWLMRHPRILIIDEPTHGIDVGAKVEIYNLLNQMVEDGVSIIIVSSDLVEVLTISQRIYVMHEGKITAELSRETTEEEIIRYASGFECSEKEKRHDN